MYIVYTRPTRDWLHLEMELRPSILGGSIISCSSTGGEFVEVKLIFDFSECPDTQIGTAAFVPSEVPEDWRLNWDKLDFGPIIAAEITVLAEQRWIQPCDLFPEEDS